MNYWSPKLCQYMVDNFVYEPLSGKVLRKNQSSNGPQQVGPVGTVHPQGHLVVAFRFEGSLVTVALHRMAIYLYTRKQYKKIRFVNNNKLDLRVDNLNAWDELTEDNGGQKSLPLEIVEARRKAKEEWQMSRHIAKQEFKKHLSEPLGPGEKWLKDNPTGRVEESVYAQKPTKAGQLYDSLFHDFVQERYKLGFFTGAANNDVMAFLRETRNRRRFATIDDIPKDFTSSEEYRALSKWEQDLILAMRFEQMFLNRRDTVENFNKNILEHYDFEGKYVRGSYNELPPEQLAMVDKVRLEESQQSTAATQPLEPSSDEDNPANSRHIEPSD